MREEGYDVQQWGCEEHHLIIFNSAGRRFLLHRGDEKIELSYMSGGAGYVLSRAALRLLVRAQTLLRFVFLNARMAKTKITDSAPSYPLSG